MPCTSASQLTRAGHTMSKLSLVVDCRLEACGMRLGTHCGQVECTVGGVARAEPRGGGAARPGQVVRIQDVHRWRGAMGGWPHVVPLTPIHDHAAPICVTGSHRLSLCVSRCPSELLPASLPSKHSCRWEARRQIACHQKLGMARVYSQTLVGSGAAHVVLTGIGAGCVVEEEVWRRSGGLHGHPRRRCAIMRDPYPLQQHSVLYSRQQNSSR